MEEKEQKQTAEEIKKTKAQETPAQEQPIDLENDGSFHILIQVKENATSTFSYNIFDDFPESDQKDKRGDIWSVVRDNPEEKTEVTKTQLRILHLVQAAATLRAKEVAEEYKKQEGQDIDENATYVAITQAVMDVLYPTGPAEEETPTEPKETK